MGWSTLRRLRGRKIGLCARGRYAQQGLLNIVGGCCGTYPSHIKMMMETVNALARMLRTSAKAGPADSTVSPRELLASTAQKWCL